MLHAHSTPAHGSASGAPVETLSLLRMAVGSETLAVAIDDVREILQVTRLTPLPRTPAFVRGVMNLRGAVVPVIDLAARLGGPPTVPGRRACIVVVDCHGEAQDESDAGSASLTMGLLVDAVYEVFDRSAAEVEPAPPLGTRIHAQHLRGMTRSGGELIGVLSLSHVLAAHDLTQAIEHWQPH